GFGDEETSSGSCRLYDQGSRACAVSRRTGRQGRDRGLASNRFALARARTRLGLAFFVLQASGAVKLAEFFFFPVGEKPRLPGPFLAHDAAVEFQMIVHPRDLFLGPGRDLVEMVEAQPVQGLFILGADAADALEIVGPTLSRCGDALRPRPRRRNA